MEPEQPKRSIEPLIAALAAGMSYTAAAAHVRCSRSTVIRRMKDAGFRERVQQARLRLLDESLGRLSASLSEAVEKLRQLLNAESETVQLGAASRLVGLLLPVKLMADIETRLRKLERR